MTAWWSGLTPLNQFFWGLVVLFTTLFMWQLIASFVGLGDAGHGDVDGGGGMHFGDGHVGDIHAGDMHAGDMHVGDAHLDAGAHLEAGHDAGAADRPAEHASALGSFRLISVRSVLAFLTLFSWAGALYLGRGWSSMQAFLLAALWGAMGMVAVAAIFWAIPRLTEEGTMSVAKTIGMTATVYVNIPRQGTGQVRILVGDRISYLRARSATGYGIKAGTAVRVVGLDGTVLEVEETG